MAKVEQPKMVAKAKPKEEKTGGPSNEKTSCDAIVVKPITELESKIIQQVEVQYLLHHDKLLNFRYWSSCILLQYYFGNFNLPRDKILNEQILIDDGWVSLNTMLKYPRLQQLTKRPQVIMRALEKSTSGLLEISKSACKIRRSKEKPVPEETTEYVAEVMDRTVYCKGFPKKALTLTNSWISSNPIPKLWILRFCFLIQFPNVMILTGISIADDSLRQYRGKNRFQRIRDCYIFYKGRSWDFHVSRFRQIQWFHHSSSVVVSPIVTFCLNRVEDKKSKEQMLVSSILVWVLKINVMLFFKSQIGKGENWKGGSPSAPESQNGI